MTRPININSCLIKNINRLHIVREDMNAISIFRSIINKSRSKSKAKKRKK